jgi:hypothetical protein
MSRSQSVTRPEPDFPMTSYPRDRRVWTAAALILVAVLLVTAMAFATPTVTAVVSYLEGMRSAHAQFTPHYVLYLGYILLCAVGVAICLPVGALLTAAGGNRAECNWSWRCAIWRASENFCHRSVAGAGISSPVRWNWRARGAGYHPPAP